MPAQLVWSMSVDVPQQAGLLKSYTFERWSRTASLHEAGLRSTSLHEAGCLCVPKIFLAVSKGAARAGSMVLCLLARERRAYTDGDGGLPKAGRFASVSNSLLMQLMVTTLLYFQR